MRVCKVKLRWGVFILPSPDLNRTWAIASQKRRAEDAGTGVPQHQSLIPYAVPASLAQPQAPSDLCLLDIDNNAFWGFIYLLIWF